MNHNDLATIEQRLGLTLPEAYSQLLIKRVAINGLNLEPYLQQDQRELLIQNHELRMYPVPNGFGGASWPDNYICIGNDGCGNYYCISSDDPSCAVLFFDHEADLFELISENLPDYIKYITDLLSRVHNNSPSDVDESSRNGKSMPPSPDAVVTRAETPRECVLNPITFEE